MAQVNNTPEHTDPARQLIFTSYFKFYTNIYISLKFTKRKIASKQSNENAMTPFGHHLKLIILI